ncbi:Trypsin like peptidase domain [Trypanosoma vivax]|uniref:Serine protease n=1 Tax=Trypanosoma vivax (strain Y486) TaxID=1055687 RepID=G0U678_TRYVY|nr:hypothetical protein TRVL_03209 [Trypanosoma vivax]KAH8611250.1 Trypsin like peptidase domain [Trypanosoma vivax]CCC51381.1 conserved hypothetical protein [Trypanosoma vivax Y486]
MSSVPLGGGRGSIPAVCRIKGRGTGTLISPGLLLTSTHVVSSPEACDQVTAVFFEGIKKKTVEVKLLPHKFFFAAAYPEYMDYCLVACEQFGIFNVTPVKVPLVKDEWATVTEGDTVLIIQHPIGEYSTIAGDVDTNDANTSQFGSPLEVKRFEEVLRHRGDLFYLKTTRNVVTAGCPTFNDSGQLIGLQSQVHHQHEGMVNRVVSITSIVKHLFTNKLLWRIGQQLTFESVWNTWYVKGDITRIVCMMANFKDRVILRATAEKLCEHTGQPHLLESIVKYGGVEVITQTLDQFKEDEAMVCSCLRAIWNISFGGTSAQAPLVEGNAIEMALNSMETFPKNEEIAQFSTLFLHNISSEAFSRNFAGPLGYRALRLVHAAQKKFKETTVLQKFGFGFFKTLVEVDEQNAEILVDLGILKHVVYLAKEKQNQVLLMESIMQFLGVLAQNHHAIDKCLKESALCLGSEGKGLSVLTGLLIDIMVKYQDEDTILLEGNRALWGIGNDFTCRAMILQHPRIYDALKLSLPVLIARSRVT